MANPAYIRKRIMARKAEKDAAEKVKYAQMRQIAFGDASGVEKDLVQLADACAAQAEAFDALRENLDLIQAPKEASLKLKTAILRRYAKEFKRIAEEAPQELAQAVSESYHSLDEIAGAIENLAGTLGIDLGATPAEEAFAEEGIQEMDQAEEENVPMGDVPEPGMEGEEEEKEAAGGGGGWYTTDRDSTGQPKKPLDVTVPRAASNNDAWVNDRDKNSKPERPAKMKIPQAEGEGQTPGNKGASRKKADEQIYNAYGNTPEPASAFIKDIPQAEGQGQTPANKAGHVRPLTQMVTPAKPAQPAEAFVKDIPQAEGQGQTPGNKQSRLRRPLVKKQSA